MFVLIIGAGIERKKIYESFGFLFLEGEDYMMGNFLWKLRMVNKKGNFYRVVSIYWLYRKLGCSSIE